MKIKQYSLLFLLGLLTSSLGAIWVRSPGFMDADYYYANGIQLSRGMGFIEPFLWNYLDDPSSVPHPSHLYWMPLTSIIVAPFLFIFGESFRAAQIPIILLSSFLPVLTASLAFSLTSKPKSALTSGLLAVFPGFFFPFFLTTDAFVLFGLVGGGTLWLISRQCERSTMFGWFLVGGMVALGHLSRADGILLMVPAMMGLVLSIDRSWKQGLVLVFGYLMVIAPWVARNLLVAGSLFSPGGLKSLWLLEYNDLFSFPASQLTFSRWVQSGIGSILQVRFDATIQNLQSLVAVNGLVFLLPFAIVALWRWRTKTLVRISLIYWFALFASMSLAFPFVGARGAYFHSSTAIMPLIWAASPFGLSITIDWISGRRKWDRTHAQRVFRVAMVVGVIVLTSSLFYSRVISKAGKGDGWNRSEMAYEIVASTFSDLFREGDIVLINNPPGFHLEVGLASIVIPQGSLEDLKAVADQYQANWVVLEENHPQGLDALYSNPGVASWLKLVGRVRGEVTGEVLLFEIVGARER